MPKIVVGIFVTALMLSVTGNTGGGPNGILIVAGWMGAIGLGCFMLYLAYDTFRSTILSGQPKTSADNLDSPSLTGRLTAVACGVILGIAGSFCLFWILTG